MKKKIPVLIIHDPDNMDEVYRLDEKGRGEDFFHDLINNYEANDVRKFTKQYWNHQQWKRAVEAGKCEAGEMSDKEMDRYIRKLKRRKKLPSVFQVAN